MSAVPGRIQSIERAAAVLRLLSDSSRLHGPAELAGELGLSRSTVHGILKTLRHVGFVEQDERTGGYRLGAALLHMGSSYLDGNELRTRALNWADSLALRSAESVRIGTLHEQRVLIVHHVFRPDDTRQHLQVGALLPTHATALGKVLLASREYLVDEVAESGLGAFTKQTITDARRLRTELRHVRERGWGADVEELIVGECSIAAPIVDVQGVVVGAIGISGPVERLCGKRRDPSRRHVSYVREASRAVSHELEEIPR